MKKLFVPEPRALGGGKLLGDLRQVTPEAEARDFIKHKTAMLMEWFYDADDVGLPFEIRRDKDGSWFASCDEHRIYCHGDTMRELQHHIHMIVRAFSSKKAHSG